MSGIMREVSIRPALNGFIVHVGCQTLVFGDIMELLAELKSYHISPDGVEKRYRESAVNKGLLGVVPQLECDPNQNVQATLGATGSTVTFNAELRPRNPNTSADTSNQTERSSI